MSILTKERPEKNENVHFIVFFTRSSTLKCRNPPGELKNGYKTAFWKHPTVHRALEHNGLVSRRNDGDNGHRLKSWNRKCKKGKDGRGQTARRKRRRRKRRSRWDGYVRALLSVSARHSLTSARAWMIPAHTHTQVFMRCIATLISIPLISFIRTREAGAGRSS